jgi:hypothetical protein
LGKGYRPEHRVAAVVRPRSRALAGVPAPHAQELDRIRALAKTQTGRKEGVREMASRFKIGDHVSWNSEAGRVTGTIVAIHTTDFNYKGHVHHASEDDPQYEIRSDKTDHIAAHKGSVLERVPN